MPETIRSRRGAYRHYLTIERRVETTEDSRGAIVPSWLPVANRWGEIRPLSGRELFQAQQVENDVTHRIEFDYFEDLTSTHRIKWDDTRGNEHTAHIKSFIDVEECGVKQVCMCIERKT